MMGAERQDQKQMIHKMKQFESVVYDAWGQDVHNYWQIVLATNVLTTVTTVND